MPDKNQSSSSHSVSHFGLIAGASALVLYGLSRRNKAGVALATAGGLLAYQQARSTSNGSRDSVSRAAFRVNKSAAEAYQLWHDFARLPRFMSHLESVRVLDDRHSEWVAQGPMKSRVRWTAEITDDQPNRRIAWRSIPGSEINTSGSVEFQDEPFGRGSMVRAEVEYTNPAGPVARGLLSVMGKHPDFVVKEDVRRFKALLEAGEAPTTRGQSHGPRGLHGRTEEVLFRETSNHPLPQAS